MADAPNASSTRPVLKGRHAVFMKKHLAIGLISSCLLVYATKVLVNDKRKEAYAKFYRYVFVMHSINFIVTFSWIMTLCVLIAHFSNYDIDADFHRIRNLGYFQSCAPDGEE